MEVSTSKQSFIDSIMPYANKAGAALSTDPGYIAAQWAHETGYGTNGGTVINNLAGVNAYPGSPYGSSGQAFTSLDDFTNYYVNMIKTLYPDAPKATNVTGYADALVSGVNKYATDPNYSASGTWTEAYQLAKASDTGATVGVTGGGGGNTTATTQQPSTTQDTGFFAPLTNTMSNIFSNGMFWLLVIVFLGLFAYVLFLSGKEILS